MTPADSGQLRVVHGLLLPGKVIGDGRYRLLRRTGIDDRDGAQLWRARDGQLRRDVAATVLTGDPADAAAARRARRSLAQAAYPSELDHPAVARVLNVMSVGDGLPRSEGVLGVVLAEWSGAPS